MLVKTKPRRIQLLVKTASVERLTSEANRLCTRVYVLISATKKGGWCVGAVVTVAPHCTTGQDW